MTELSSPASTVDSHSPRVTTPNYHNDAVIIIRKPSLRGLHMQANGDDSETDGMSTSEFAALPTPPRHHYKPNPHIVYHQQNGSTPNVGSASTSPTIPMFSTQDVVNQFQHAKGGGVGSSRSLNSSTTSQSAGMSPDEFGVANAALPPPRPRRSNKRKTPIMGQGGSTRPSMDREPDGRDNHNRRAPPSMSTPIPRERMLGLSGFDEDGDGRAYGTFGSSQSRGVVEIIKTSRDSASSREDVKLSSSTNSRSPLKFREFGNGEGEWKDRRALTEKEKADRWDDLLEMSDRAGGTIHIGGSKLASDSLRFSDYSTLTTLAL